MGSLTVWTLQERTGLGGTIPLHPGGETGGLFRVGVTVGEVSENHRNFSVCYNKIDLFVERDLDFGWFFCILGL